MQADDRRPPVPIRIAAGIVLDDRGRMLVVRKRGTTIYIQPGGKIEPGETPEAALCREIREELDCAPTRAEPCGRFTAPAAHQPGRHVEADLFHVTLPTDQVRATAEIAELRWIDPAQPGDLPLALLLSTYALPLAIARRA